MGHLRHGHPHQFFFGIPSHLTETGIDQQQLPRAHIGLDKTNSGLFECCRGPRFAQSQLRFDAFAIANIPHLGKVIFLTFKFKEIHHHFDRENRSILMLVEGF